MKNAAHEMKKIEPEGKRRSWTGTFSMQPHTRELSWK